MRAAAAITHTADQVRKHFEPDVAAAIIGDTDPFENAVRLLGHTAVTADQIAAAVASIAHGTDDRLADWLVEAAESPGAWFYSQCKEETEA